ncbi:GTP cyclohydrolase I FolE [Streptomyces sp900105245]|uniref:GTP cyclohydrolase 1 n=1 Tax=Streptomyces sp. 900105245 TaxID=3154379 RepID=A0ABV1UN86_9ACTN
MTVSDLGSVDELTIAQPDDAAFHVAGLLKALDLRLDDENALATPERFAKALTELTAGYHVRPERHLEVTFDAPGPPALITVKKVRFTSLCEHHLLPFTGRATISYLPSPGARIVGLSKLVRLFQDYAARPQIQERLTWQVVEAIMTELDVQGAACKVVSSHSCLTLRGARAHEARMVTKWATGVLRDAPVLRSAGHSK